MTASFKKKKCAAVSISICSFIILVSLIAPLGKDRLKQQQRKLPASPPCSQAFVSETPGGSGGKDPLFISPARARRQQSTATLPARHFSWEQDACSALSFPAVMPAAHRSLRAVQAAAVEELHQKQEKAALPQPGLGQPRWRGSCCDRATPPAGMQGASPACMGNGPCHPQGQSWSLLYHGLKSLQRQIQPS